MVRPCSLHAQPNHAIRGNSTGAVQGKAPVPRPTPCWGAPGPAGDSPTALALHLGSARRCLPPAPELLPQLLLPAHPAVTEHCISNSLILKIFYSVLKYLSTSTRGRAFSFARLDHRRQDMQWRRGGGDPAGCRCRKLGGGGTGGLSGFLHPPVSCPEGTAGRRSRVRAQLGHGSAGSTAPSQPHCTPASARPARAEASVRAWRQRSSRQGRCVQYLPSKVAALLFLPILMA